MVIKRFGFGTSDLEFGISKSKVKNYTITVNENKIFFSQKPKRTHRKNPDKKSLCNKI